VVVDQDGYQKGALEPVSDGHVPPAERAGADQGPVTRYVDRAGYRHADAVEPVVAGDQRGGRGDRQVQRLLGRRGDIERYPAQLGDRAGQVTPPDRDLADPQVDTDRVDAFPDQPDQGGPGTPLVRPALDTDLGKHLLVDEL